MDVVYQLLRQFPVAFEFNHRLLSTIIDAVYECKFGTFLFDTPRERQSYNVTTTTTSIWSYVNDASIRSRFINPFYEPEKYARNCVLRCSPHREDIRFWRTFYLRWFRHVGEHDTYDFLEKRYTEISIEKEMMEKEIRELKRRLGEDVNTPLTPRRATTEEEEDDDEWDHVDQFISTGVPPNPNDNFTFERRTTVGDRNRMRTTSHVAWSNLERQKQPPSLSEQQQQQEGEQQQQQHLSSLFISDPEDPEGGNAATAGEPEVVEKHAEADEAELSQKAMDRLASMYQRLEQERNVVQMQLNASNTDVLKGKLDHILQQQAQVQVMMQQVSGGSTGLTGSSSSSALRSTSSGASL